MPRLTAGQARRSLLQKLDKYRVLDETTGCLNWTSAHVRGRGQVWYKGKTQYVHRLVYEMTYGSIDPNIAVLHTCDNPSCSNPKHLFIGTQKDNMQDRSNKGRYSCDLVHNLTEEQLIILSNKANTVRTRMRLAGLPEGSATRLIPVAEAWKKEKEDAIYQAAHARLLLEVL